MWYKQEIIFTLENMDLFEIARTNMVRNQVMPNHVKDERILESMLNLPRHEFVDSKFKSIAYFDGRPYMDAKRTMLAPDVLARMVQALNITHTDKILHVACGTAYSTILLAGMGREVLALEADEALAQKALQNIKNFGLTNVSVVNDEHLVGMPGEAPFNAILVEGKLNCEPTLLLQQLADKGKLVCIMQANKNLAKAYLFEKHGTSITCVELFTAFAEGI